VAVVQPIRRDAHAMPCIHNSISTRHGSLLCAFLCVRKHRRRWNVDIACASHRVRTMLCNLWLLYVPFYAARLCLCAPLYAAMAMHIIYIYLYIYIYIYISTSMCVYVYVHICICIYVYINIMHIYIYIYIYIYMIYVYIYVYIYIYIYININVYIYIFMTSCSTRTLMHATSCYVYGYGYGCGCGYGFNSLQNYGLCFGYQAQSANMTKRSSVKKWSF
jgi:hypothetical protein